MAKKFQEKNLQKLLNIQIWRQTNPNIPIYGEILENRDFFHIEKNEFPRKNLKKFQFLKLKNGLKRS